MNNQVYIQYDETNHCWTIIDAYGRQIAKYYNKQKAEDQLDYIQTREK